MNPSKQGRCVVCETPLSAAPVIRIGARDLFRCAGCESWTCLPRPSATGLAAIHDDPAYFDHPYFQDRRVDQRSITRRCCAAFTRIAAGIDLASLRGERLLDVGCDTGAFLDAACSLYGIAPVGVDVSVRAVAHAKARGIEAHAVFLEDAPPHLRDLALITALDLIEHVADPRTFLRSVHARLRPGGILYLETPNIQSTIYRLGRSLFNLWAGCAKGMFERLFPTEHVQYFSDRGLTTLASSCDLQLVQLTKRRLYWSDIATSHPVRLSLESLQAVDALVGQPILLCALLRRRS